MLWIGLTGGIGSGKSTVAGLFKKAGVPVADADELARLALGPGSEASQKVLSHFGPGVLGDDQGIDRRKLGALVFQNPAELRYLESLIHPVVQKKTRELRERFESEGHAFAIYDVPLLFEKNLNAQFDRVLVVGCRQETQLKRLALRSGLSQAEALQRIQNQMNLDEKMKKADDTIWNEAGLDQLEIQVESLIQKFNKLSSKA